MWLISRQSMLAVALWMTGSVAHAQMATGSITGIVKDASGGVLPGVTISLAGDRLIGGTQTRVTGTGGTYRFDRLPPSSYDLKFELSGFKTVQRTGVWVSAAFTATVNVQLELGSLGETVTVIGQSPTVDTRSNVQQTVLNQELLEGIPTGRDPWSLAKIIPGVQVSKYDVGGTEGMLQSELSAHGSVIADKTYAINGVSTNFPGGPGGWIMVYPDQALFEEINYQTAALPAEVPGGGIYINMVTKEAGNRWQGNLSYRYANDDLQAENHKTPELEQFGFAGGNPVVRQYDFDLVGGGRLVKDKVWLLAGARRWKVDKLLLGARNLDGEPTVDDSLIQSYSGQLTWQAAKGHKFHFLYTRNPNQRFHRRDIPPAFVDDRATGFQDQLVHLAQVRYTGALGKVVVESTVNRQWGKADLLYQTDVKETDIRIEDPIRSTATVAGRQSQNATPITRLQFDNSFSYSMPGLGGWHSLKAGVQFARQAFGRRDRVNGDMHIILHDGVPDSVRVFNTPRESVAYIRRLGLFAQDSWTIRPGLTLNLGGRLDFAHGWTPEISLPAGRFIGERHFERRDPVMQSIAAWRTGLAYDPRGDGKTALKASFSRYAQQVGTDLVDNVNPVGLSSSLRTWSDFNNDSFPQDNELGPFPGFSVTNIRYARPDGPDWPYSHEITAGVERQLTHDLRVSVMYYHRTNRRLIARRNMAIPPTAYTQQSVPLPGPPLGPGGTAVFYNLDPSFLGLQDNVLDNDPLLDTTYNGVEFIASKRFSNRWQLLAGLTLGKNEGGLTPAFFFPDLSDPNNLINQQGIVGDDSKYSLKVAGSYLVPGDLMVSGSLLYNDGYPYGGTYSPSGSTYTITRAAFPGLTLPAQTVAISKRGVERLPDVLIIDLRFSRPIPLGKNRQISPQLEIFNLTNASTVVDLTSAVGSRWRFPTQILPPRIFRIGFSLDF